MSPRPKRIEDAALVAGTARVIERLGPARLTLGDVAKEVGLAPATLVQRFGSKRGLLLAVARQGAGSVREEFARIRGAHRSPLAALGAVGACMAQMARTPEALANSLAFFQMDIADPEFHRLARAHARQFRAELQAMLDEAVESGELRRCSTARLANTVQGLIGGSMMNWAIHREGKAGPWIETDLETLLAPLRAPRGTLQKAARRKSKRRD
jgi:AcrR family transcriptional regulator